MYSPKDPVNDLSTSRRSFSTRNNCESPLPRYRSAKKLFPNQNQKKDILVHNHTPYKENFKPRIRIIKDANMISPMVGDNDNKHPIQSEKKSRNTSSSFEPC